ncbi:hypothetical protein GGTG_06994 [Gaeumannomyces tritici R3-111a-1]|uniref:Uncharacterized protein n=1 Tax=Gaeumannomyces tritici (strain R3-111a-1) TaxID=644352 RepID=J3P0E7_GAET3|nr:hypothetical protein GGTG_06994 [Gaeumannomyces tritici R3-111a-1]EJT77080.1 hypothetical protein GGTG_06994 [Gaeumannomyces tritici R3-111a-1]
MQEKKGLRRHGAKYASSLYQGSELGCALTELDARYLWMLADVPEPLCGSSTGRGILADNVRAAATLTRPSAKPELSTNAGGALVSSDFLIPVVADNAERSVCGPLLRACTTARRRLRAAGRVENGTLPTEPTVIVDSAPSDGAA